MGTRLIYAGLMDVYNREFLPCMIVFHSNVKISRDGDVDGYSTCYAECELMCIGISKVGWDWQTAKTMQSLCPLS